VPVAAAPLYRDAILIDTSAVIALLDEADQFHQHAKLYFEGVPAGTRWVAMNITSHETFTTSRYASDLAAALRRYDFLRTPPVTVVTFSLEDEVAARALLARYDDQVLSFHDALCAVVMLRLGIYRVFTFDRDFWIMGFSVEPGATH
jgi:predicted nucleic acid-binding protein